MSLDYPYYEELCRRRHRAAWWWLVGDRLYYLGLLPGVCAAAGGPVGLAAGLLGFGWGGLLVAAVVFPPAAVTHVIGSAMKRHAYTLGERDGINSREVWNTAARRPPGPANTPPGNDA